MSPNRERFAATLERARHWDAAYEAREMSGMSWFQAIPLTSLELIDAAGVAAGAPVLDVGGGTSGLARHLVERGATEVWVLDASGSALAAAAESLGEARSAVHLTQQDVLEWEPERTFSLWHDRACFHFLVDPGDRARYVRAMRAALAEDGRVVVATFAEDGPRSCSGLPVAGYTAEQLGAALGIEVVASRREEHRTPTGTLQPFTWVAGRLTSQTAGAPVTIGPRRVTSNDMLVAARARIRRLHPRAARDAAENGAVIVDIRSSGDRERDGVVPGSVHIPRTVLEWRLDPDSPWRTPHLNGLEQELLLLCDHGYSSSLAAAALVDSGFAGVGDVVDGFLGWTSAGLPTVAAGDHTLAPGELVGMRPPERAVERGRCAGAVVPSAANSA